MQPKFGTSRLKGSMDNSELFYKLLEPIHPKAEAFSRKLAGNKDDGDDLYQDALLKAYKSFETLKDHSAFKPWLFRIIVNLFKSRVRVLKWKMFVSMTLETAERQSIDPTNKLSAKRYLSIAFKALNAEEKALTILSEIDGWTIAELSDLLSKPTGTIKAKLARSKKKMRKKLISYFDTDEKPFKGEIPCVVMKPKTK